VAGSGHRLEVHRGAQGRCPRLVTVKTYDVVPVLPSLWLTLSIEKSAHYRRSRSCLSRPVADRPATRVAQMDREYSSDSNVVSPSPKLGPAWSSHWRRIQCAVIRLIIVSATVVFHPRLEVHRGAQCRAPVLVTVRHTRSSPYLLLCASHQQSRSSAQCHVDIVPVPLALLIVESSLGEMDVNASSVSKVYHRFTAPDLLLVSLAASLAPMFAWYRCPLRSLFAPSGIHRRISAATCLRIVKTYEVVPACLRCGSHHQSKAWCRVIVDNGPCAIAG